MGSISIGKLMRDWNRFLTKVSLHYFDAEKNKDFSSRLLDIGEKS